MRRCLESFDSYLETIAVQGHTARQIRVLDLVVLMVVTTVRVLCGDFFLIRNPSIDSLRALPGLLVGVPRPISSSPAHGILFWGGIFLPFSGDFLPRTAWASGARIHSIAGFPLPIEQRSQTNWTLHSELVEQKHFLSLQVACACPPVQSSPVPIEPSPTRTNAAPLSTIAMSDAGDAAPCMTFLFHINKTNRIDNAAHVASRCCVLSFSIFFPFVFSFSFSA